MAQTQQPPGPSELLERGRRLIDTGSEEVTSAVLLGHAYVIAASICQRLDALEGALREARDKPPADKPAAAHYRRDEGSSGQGSRT
jgi:hypothetical protein